ncbi:DUF4129 domain-containing protein [Gryllotalpicola reticulitermitis]|uniref:DUF4129 domain-containing protein n=1 Tax=Gryllotalpicola reticulitermitis TaxID=1184153 RepID=A0ABV8Q8K0_9MICO
MLGVILIAATAWSGGPHLGTPRWVPNAGLFGGAPRPISPIQSPAPTQPPQTASRSVSGLLVMLIVAVIAGVVLFFILRAVLRGRTRRIALPPLGAIDEVQTAPVAAEVEQEPDAPTVHRGLLSALDALDGEREPADAVVKAWLGLQAAADDSGVERRAAETPTEFTARIITRVRADSAAAGALVDVYQAVRFGSHPITAHEVNTARTAVQKLLASWHDPMLASRR